MTTEKDSGNPFDDAPVIFSYSRRQAIEDGVLIDLTEWAKQTGFKFPVACTAAVWNGYIVPPPGMEGYGQSERGRAHDILWLLWCAIRRGQGGSQVDFEVIFLQDPERQETVQFKALCGPGDQGDPVITILRPEED